MLKLSSCHFADVSTLLDTAASPSPLSAPPAAAPPGFLRRSCDDLAAVSDGLWRKLDAIEKAPTPIQQAHLVDRLVQNLSQQHGFSDALAGSFFGDLGHPGFVKADVHVVDVTTSALGLDRAASSAKCFELCRDLAECSRGMDEVPHLTPRGADKLIYLACSGNFYLVGAADNKRLLRQALEELRIA